MGVYILDTHNCLKNLKVFCPFFDKPNMGAIKIRNILKFSKSEDVNPLQKELDNLKQELLESEENLLKFKAENELLSKKILLVHEENKNLKTNLTMVQQNLADSVNNGHAVMTNLNQSDKSFDTMK